MNEKTLSNITALGEGFTTEFKHFDETPCQDFKIDRDLTPEAWARFAARAHIPDGMDPIVALENLHLLEGGTMTHAGAWLLAEDITRYTLTAGVTCAVLRGVTNTHIIDLKNFTGDICAIYDDCIAYMQAKLNTALIPMLTDGTNGSSYRRMHSAKQWSTPSSIETIDPPLKCRYTYSMIGWKSSHRAGCQRECGKKIWGSEACRGIHFYSECSTSWEW